MQRPDVNQMWSGVDERLQDARNGYVRPSSWREERGQGEESYVRGSSRMRANGDERGQEKSHRVRETSPERYSPVRSLSPVSVRELERGDHRLRYSPHAFYQPIECERPGEG